MARAIHGDVMLVVVVCTPTSAYVPPPSLVLDDRPPVMTLPDVQTLHPPFAFNTQHMSMTTRHPPKRQKTTKPYTLPTHAQPQDLRSKQSCL